ncbi:MAG TPA: hypothetical protein VEK57_12590 [Thermoanaerobaculia bacterium]|nr:hypothetical protein [Thermoanaerobaculia bacterium]
MTTLPAVQMTDANAPREPYRGIQEFRYIDAPIYFGRDFEARRLLRLVTIYRGVLLYGDSGVGKSSLVNAKAMPLAVEEGYAPERIRVQPVPGAELVVERILRGAGNDFLPSLFDDGRGTRRISIAAAELLRKVKETPVAEGSYPLLIFDQFEELVTLTEQAARRGRESAAQAQAAYDSVVSTLITILRDDSLRAKLLFVFREDYYAKLTKFFACHPTLIDNYLRVEPLHSNQLDAIITGPFREVDFGRRLDDEVTELLKSELRARSDSDVLNLSEVQIACLRLWRAEKPLDMLKTQHVSGLLETYFSEAIGSLPEQLHRPAEAIMDALVTESGTRDVVSEATLLEMLQRDQDVPAAVATAALTELDQTARVIRRERRNDVFVYEIVSEFLVPWIMRRKVEAQAKLDLEASFARTRRMFRRIAVAAVVAIVILFAVREYQTSNEALRRNVRELGEANSSLEAKLEAAGEEMERLQREGAEAEKGRQAAAARAAHLTIERDAARTAQRNAEAQRNLAVVSREQAVEQSIKDRAARGTAVTDRNNAIEEKNAAVAEKDAALAAREEANRRREAALTEGSELKQGLQKMTADRDDLRAQLAALTTRHTASTVELRTARSERTALATQLATATTELKTVRSDRNSLASKLENETARNSAVRSERDQLASQLEKARATIRRLEAEVAAVRELLAAKKPGGP